MTDSEPAPRRGRRPAADYSGPRRLSLFGEPVEPATARTLVTNLLHGIGP